MVIIFLSAFSNWYLFDKHPCQAVIAWLLDNMRNLGYMIFLVATRHNLSLPCITNDHDNDLSNATTLLTGAIDSYNVPNLDIPCVCVD